MVKVFKNANEIREAFPDLTQIIFAENFFNYPVSYTYKNMTIWQMHDSGMILELLIRYEEDGKQLTFNNKDLELRLETL